MQPPPPPAAATSTGNTTTPPTATTTPLETPRTSRREFYSSPRILFFTLTKEIFAESTRLSSRRRILLSAKTRFPVVIIEYMEHIFYIHE
jgi:hypothetical protein